MISLPISPEISSHLIRSHPFSPEISSHLTWDLIPISPEISSHHILDHVRDGSTSRVRWDKISGEVERDLTTCRDITWDLLHSPHEISPYLTEISWCDMGPDLGWVGAHISHCFHVEVALRFTWARSHSRFRAILSHLSRQDLREIGRDHTWMIYGASFVLWCHRALSDKTEEKKCLL